MSDQDIQLDLYQQVILDHNRNPRNFGDNPNASHKAEGYNPLCGDHLWVYLVMDQETKIIKDVNFNGQGCAISKASASMMTTALKGKTFAEAEELFAEFKALLVGDLDPEKQPNKLGKLKIFSSIWRYPSRVKCAGLAWHAVNGALHDESTVSTETADNKAPEEEK